MAKTCSGILRLVLKSDASIETASCVTRHAHLQRSLLVGQHDEPALGACRLDCGVENDGEHFVEYALGPHRPQRGKQRRHLAELTDGADAAVFTRPTLVHEEDQGRFGGVSALDLIAVREWLFDHSRAVDVGAVLRLSIPDDVAVACQHDLSVVARDLGSVQDQIAVRPPANPERVLVDDDDAMTERVAHGESRLRWPGHGGVRLVQFCRRVIDEERLSVRRELTRKRCPSGITSKNERGPTGRTSNSACGATTWSSEPRTSSDTAMSLLSRPA